MGGTDLTALPSVLQASYRDLGVLDEGHRVHLIQSVSSRKLLVLKVYETYNLPVYLWLQAHPVTNMPQIVDLAEADNRLVVIEEYLHGDTLREWLDTQGCLTERETARCVVELCAILCQLHSAQPPILHRDIKPENLIRTSDGVLKLIDINAARVCREDKPRDTVLLGTAGYAAPEQYGTGSSSVRTDVYAVGALMNELLCGALPAVRIASGRLSPVIRRCLEVNPNNRYASAQQLSAAVCRAVPEWSWDGPAWKRFLPPGFRSQTPSHMACALPAYLLGGRLLMGLEVSDARSGAELWLHRVVLGLLAVALVLFTGDYLEVQERWPLTRKGGRLRRTALILLTDGVLTLLALLLLGALRGLLPH